MVLVLSRGGFCPNERGQAEGLVQLHRELEVAYCRLVTISTDNITETNEYRSGVGAHWPFLSDAGRMVQAEMTRGPRMHRAFAGLIRAIQELNGQALRVLAQRPGVVPAVAQLPSSWV